MSLIYSPLFIFQWVNLNTFMAPGMEVDTCCKYLSIVRSVQHMSTCVHWSNDRRYMCRPRTLGRLATHRQCKDTTQRRVRPPMPSPVQFYKSFLSMNTTKLNQLVKRPEQFNGYKPHPRIWIEDYLDAIEDNGWSEAVAIKYIKTFLTGSSWLVQAWGETIINIRYIVEWFLQTVWGQLFGSCR